MTNTMSGCCDDLRHMRDCILVSCCNLFIVPIIFFLLISLLDFLIGPAPSLTFTLNDVKLYSFNISSTLTLTSNFQLNISCQKDDYTTSFHLDNINIYALYNTQQITLPTIIPPTRLDLQGFHPGSSPYELPQPDNADTVWSPYINGTEVPLTPSLASSLVKDEAAGNMSIIVKVTARLRTEFGSLSRRYRLKVSCPADIMFGKYKNLDSKVVGSAVKSRFGEDCDVHV